MNSEGIHSRKKPVQKPMVASAGYQKMSNGEEDGNRIYGCLAVTTAILAIILGIFVIGGIVLMIVSLVIHLRTPDESAICDDSNMCTADFMIGDFCEYRYWPNTLACHDDCVALGWCTKGECIGECIGACEGTDRSTCPIRYAIDPTTLDSWSNDSYGWMTLANGCLLGGCYDVLVFGTYNPNRTEFSMYEHWQVFWENETWAYNFSFPYSIFPGGFWAGPDAVDRFNDRAPWDDPLSRMCMSFLHEDSRGCTMSHMSLMAVDPNDYYATDDEDYIVACIYAYACSEPLDFQVDSYLPFPILRK